MKAGSNYSNNNKRIAKNTLMLYIRMFLMMAVTLYTSRVVLQQLGVEDFGVYNVVGGLVSTFSILTNSLSGACSRFINFELGTGNFQKLKSIVSTSFNIQIYLSIAVLIALESLGPWFLNNYMEIPSGRLVAANWVLQFTIAMFVVKLIMVPLNALIVSHERMSAYAYFSIIEVVLQLLIVFLLWVSDSDKLILYSFLMFVVSIVVFGLYLFYCLSQFKECTYSIRVDTAELKKMSGFAGWNFLGTTAGVLRNQGIDIIVNMFFGVVLNAARGVANQVNTALGKFISSFMTALNPQITHSYASGDIGRMEFLVFQGSRFSYYLMLFLTVPVVLEMDYILHLWLKTVPESAVLFSQMQLLIALVGCLSQTMVMALLATGNIRNYQLLVGGISLLCFPVAYVFLYCGFSAYVTYIVLFFSELGCLFARSYMMKKLIGVKIGKFIRQVVVKVVFVSIAACVFPIAVILLKDESFGRFVISILVSMSSCLISIYYLGLNKEERNFLLNKVGNVFGKIKPQSHN